MTDPYVLDAIRLPSALLISLDWRPLHFALQPFHHLIRLTHILAMAGFYGVIGVLDLRLMGWSPTVSLQALIGQGRLFIVLHVADERLAAAAGLRGGLSYPLQEDSIYICWNIVAIHLIPRSSNA